MAVITKKIKLRGSKGEMEREAIFDSGSTYSCIHPELAKKLEVFVRLPEPMEFSTAKEGEKVRAEERITINFYIDEYRFSDEFMVVDRLSNGVIIGAATLQKWRLKLDFEKDEIIIDPRVTKLWLLWYSQMLAQKWRATSALQYLRSRYAVCEELTHLL